MPGETIPFRRLRLFDRINMERSKTLDALAEQGPILKMGYE
jgi:hypothetical protein